MILGSKIFGSKHEEAAVLYNRAAICFKHGKQWDRAGAVYVKLANCHLKLESPHKAASAYAYVDAAYAYVGAANCYKKISIQDATQSLVQAVTLFQDIGRSDNAATYYRELGELYEQEKNIEKAMDSFEQAAEFYKIEELTSSANLCNEKVAQFAALMEQYPKAIKIFEELARFDMNDDLLKLNVKWILLDGGICQLCRGDAVGITNSFERYQEIDPPFSGSRVHKLLADLAASMDEEDVGKFTDSIKEFDRLTRLDPLKKTLLQRVETTLKAKEEE